MIERFYYAIVRDCTGETASLPCATYKEASEYAEREVAAALEILSDDHLNVNVTIVRRGYDRSADSSTH